MTLTRSIRPFLALGLVLLAASCGEDKITDETTSSPPLVKFPGEGASKTDAFGRQLAGVAAPYNADLTLSANEQQLQNDMGFRRKVAWNIVARVLDPVPLLGLAEAANNNEEITLPDGQVPRVPRWQTWYGVSDFKRMFQRLFRNLTAEERALRTPFTNQAIEEAFQWNAKAADRSARWPLGRFLKHVSSLGICDPGVADHECAIQLQSKFSGAAAGNSRIAYSPGTMSHLLKNYGAILGCLETLENVSLPQAPVNPDTNFTYCFESEFPANAVLLKAHWNRAEFGKKLPVFDTDGETLQKVIGFGSSADWANGNRTADPKPSEIYTIQLQNSDVYRLAALHIMTKELRHWVWITMWWSDKPNDDFGADRPASFRENLAPVWSNYKMGVVVDYEERDLSPAQHFGDHPTLAAAVQATNQDGLSWMSNPYIEHGRGNARTNCIGCHQHGGSAAGFDLDSDGTLDPFDLELVIENDSLFPDNGRSKLRSMFPADYLWSTERVDNLNQVIKSEAQLFDISEQDLPEVRAVKILGLPSDAALGAGEFAKNCAGCHGSDGTGTTEYPSLYDRVPPMTDPALVQRLILGKLPMPSWADLSNEQLANIRAYLRLTFDPSN